MLLMLQEEHKEHLSFLADVSLDVVSEFSRISIEFIKKGVNPKVYQNAAQKLNVDAETVQHGVEGLIYLLTESARLKVSELDFQDSIMALGFSEDIQKELLSVYLIHRKEIRLILSEMSMDLPQYQNLEWRFDVQVSSRSLQRQLTPLVIMKFHLKDSGSDEVKSLQADPVNLIHLTNELDKALQEMKSTYCRRIVRNIK